MNFAFEEEQLSLADTVAGVIGEIASLTGPDLETKHDDEAWRRLAEIGLFALLVPEAHGGVGLTLVDIALAIEALGAGLAPSSVAGTLIATDLIVRHGSDAQRADLLPRIAGGEVKIAIALYEDGGSYRLDELATKVAEGRLIGRKPAVAGALGADLLIVAVAGPGGPHLLAIDAKADGVTISSQESIDPTSSLALVSFDRVSIGNVAMIDSAAALDRLTNTGATVASGLMIGIAGRMLDAAVDYAKTRVQFGQPIGAFQAIKHRCADMAVGVEAGRSAAYYAFWAVAENDPDAFCAASMAKAYCGAIARSVCNEAIQIHGGMGFTWELGLHRFLRRAKLLEHSFGDTAFHHERVVTATLEAAAVTNAARSRLA